MKENRCRMNQVFVNRDGNLFHYQKIYFIFHNDVTIPSFSLQAHNSYIRDQWLHSVLWKVCILIPPPLLPTKKLGGEPLNIVQ